MKRVIFRWKTSILVQLVILLCHFIHAYLLLLLSLLKKIYRISKGYSMVTQVNTLTLFVYKFRIYNLREHLSFPFWFIAIIIIVIVKIIVLVVFVVHVFFVITGSLPPSPADSGVSDVDSSSSGHTSTDELKARLNPPGLGPHSPLGYHPSQQQFLTPYHYPPGHAQPHRNHIQHHYPVRPQRKHIPIQ